MNRACWLVLFAATAAPASEGSPSDELKWGVDSFGDAPRKCTTTIDGRRVLVMRPQGNENNVTIWYRTGTVHEPESRRPATARRTGP
jgi:hypothetical protein